MNKQQAIEEIKENAAGMVAMVEALPEGLNIDFVDEWSVYLLKCNFEEFIEIADILGEPTGYYMNQTNLAVRFGQIISYCTDYERVLSEYFNAECTVVEREVTEIHKSIECAR